ncbi:MAG: S-layer homology domain-containing protein [Oscillospiraceae bacterium]|jgi:hypothetical protein|nr:S-layer homology domain-containing protein [Oscillospiraceae bacterium]
MKNNCKKALSLLLALIMVFSLLPTALAVGSDISLAADKTTVAANEQFDVKLNVTSAFSYLQATVNYDKSLVEYVSSSGATIYDVKNDSTAGMVLFSVYGAAKSAGTTAATLTFKAKTTGGIAAFSIASGSIVGESGQDTRTNGTPIGGSLNVEIAVDVPTDQPPAVVPVDIWQEADLVIYTAEELFAFAESVNSGNDYSGKVVRLGADIDLKSALWLPIGTLIDNPSFGPDRPFSGVFDGDGYTISGLNINDGSLTALKSKNANINPNLALFGYTLNATIMNVTTNGTVSITTGNAAGIVAYSRSSIVKNSKNDADITILGGDHGAEVGGIAAYSGRLGTAVPQSEILNCINTGAITSYYSNAYIGGIAGSAGTIINSENSGNVSALGETRSNSNVGGIVGRNAMFTSVILDGCFNSGEVSGSASFMGGIIGDISGVATIAKIANNYNTANVTNSATALAVSGSSQPAVGGFSGGVDSGKQYFESFKFNYNTGTVTLVNPGFNENLIAYGSGKNVWSENYNGVESTKLSSSYKTVEGKQVLIWSEELPNYTVTFTGGTATIAGVTAESFLLERGRDYSYVGSNGAVGTFNVTNGDKSISLSANVEFANVPEGASITVKNTLAVDQNSVDSVYMLPNGEYNYVVTLDEQQVLTGAFIVAGTKRIITLPSLAEKVAVTFAVTPSDAVVSVTKNGIPISGTSSVFLLYENESYSYTISAPHFVSESDEFTAVADEVISVGLVRATVQVTFRVDYRDAVVEVRDNENKIVAVDLLQYPSGTKLSAAYDLFSGLPYTYKISYGGYLTQEATAIFDRTQQVTIVLERDFGQQTEPWAPNTSWYSANMASYTITTPEQLAGLAKLVNEGTTFEGKTVTLGNDISLADKPWTPIGTNGKPFEGNFDGNNNTIAGLYIKTDKNYQALFGNMSGELQDLTVYGSVNGGSSVAGVAAIATGKITGVTNYVNIVASGDFVGGIVGDAIGEIVIDDCHNHGDILHTDTAKSTGRVGGIIGRVDNGQWAVGVEAGKYSVSAFGKISNSSNTGNLTGYQYVGGIIGGQFGNIDVQYCYNSGNITGISFGKVYIGGIAGKSEGGTIDSCYNLGGIYDSPWADGHIRAVGGIAGDEEGRTGGTTAITNVYNVGEISLDVSKMSSGNSIHNVGNISGGNQFTAANQMKYANAFYLEGLIPQAAPSHADYYHWSDVFKANPLAYDTTYTTKVTVEQLTGAATLVSGDTVLSKLGPGFIADTNGINGGYPILTWQAGNTTPIEIEYAIGTPTVQGGTTSTAATNVAKAASGTTVTISVAPETGKRVYSVEVTDAAGNILALTKVTDTVFTFVMPSRRVDINVVLEKDVVGGTPRTLTLPTNLDAIWSIDVQSSGLESGKISAGNTVFVTVNLATGANTATHDGIVLTPGVTDLIELDAGEYSFTMPDNNVTLALNARYSPIAMREQTGPSGAPKVKKTYTREQMIAMSQANVYYSTWSTEVEPSIGRADLAVSLTQLLSDSGIVFEAGDKLKLLCIDGFTYEYTYEDLMGTARYYYPNIFGGSAEGKTALSPILVVKGNATTTAGEPDAGDMLNTYRFIFGQSEYEFSNNIKAGNKQPKHVTAITIIKPLGSGTGGGGGEGSTGTGNINAAIWDGKSIDITWFSKNPNASEFHISTPAQFAGLAALVNGLYNDEIDTIVGDTGGYIHANVSTSGSSGENNISTATYHWGDYNFKDKTIYLEADINMGNANYMPIGGQYLMRYNDPETKLSSSFCGTLDGQGHSVTVHSDRWAFDYGDGQSVGLIGRLGVHDNDPDSWAPAHAGVKNIIVRGSISANRSVGGIVGKIGKTAGTAIIENCANYATISATDAKGVGGIVGAAWNDGLIVNCYNAGAVSESLASPAGGIAGSVEFPIVNSYSYGIVTAPVGYAMAIGTNNGGGSYINSYYLRGSAASGGWYTGGAGGRADNAGEKVDTYMQSADFVADLNKTYNGQYGGAWTMDTRGTNRGFPILTFDGSGESNKGGAGGGSQDATIEEDEIPLSELPDMVVTITPPAAIKDGAATASVTKTEIDDAITTAEKENKLGIAIDPIIDGAVKSVTVTIPTTSAAAIAEAELSLIIDTPNGNLTFDATSLAAIAENATGDDLQIIVKSVDPKTLTAAQQEKVGDRPVIDLTVLSNGVEITDFGGGRVLVSIPYELKDGEKAEGIKLFFLADDGTLTEIVCKYNPATQRVEFALSHFSKYVILYDSTAVWENPFKDVKETDWFYDAVKFVTSRGLFNGVSATEFAPNAQMTRAMLATVLYRVEGEPAVTSANPYTDVKSGEWYTNAIIWASENGIVNGYGDGIFGTEDNITREQIVTILYRYAKLNGYNVAPSADLTKYTDAGKISDYALDAMKWAVAIGLVNGRSETTLVPEGNATRAEVATILQRFIENVVK